MSKHTQLILDDSYIAFYPELAVMLGGVNHALIFQELYYLIQGNKRRKYTANEIDGQQWVYNSYLEWQETYFPWIATGTIKRVFLDLEKRGLVTSRQGVKNKSDRRKWYTIDMEAWEQQRDKHLGNNKTPLAQIETISSQNDPIWSQNEPMYNIDTESHSESQSEVKDSTPPVGSVDGPSENETPPLDATGVQIVVGDFVTSRRPDSMMKPLEALAFSVHHGYQTVKLSRSTGDSYWARAKDLLVVTPDAMNTALDSATPEQISSNPPALILEPGTKVIWHKSASESYPGIVEKRTPKQVSVFVLDGDRSIKRKSLKPERLGSRGPESERVPKIDDLELEVLATLANGNASNYEKIVRTIAVALAKDSELVYDDLPDEDRLGFHRRAMGLWKNELKKRHAIKDIDPNDFAAFVTAWQGRDLNLPTYTGKLGQHYAVWVRNGSKLPPPKKRVEQRNVSQRPARHKPYEYHDRGIKKPGE